MAVDQSGALTPAIRMRRAVLSLIWTGLALAALVWALPVSAYPWMKSLHVVAVISWMAGMLYLPRLFVYHTQVAVGSETSELFKVMERRLLEYIMNPAMIVSWVAGVWIAWAVLDWQGGWLHLKLALVVGLSAAHGYLAKATRDFAADRNRQPTRHWRIVNEVPTLLMVGIVVLVIFKPF
jgi:protoporphyrinogen IX oxidase